MIFMILEGVKDADRRSTMWPLLRSFGGTFAVGAFLRLLNDIFLYLTPLVIISSTSSDFSMISSSTSPLW